MEDIRKRLLAIEDRLEKGWKDQPRVPRGNPDGGEWSGGGGGSGGGGSSKPSRWATNASGMPTLWSGDSIAGTMAPTRGKNKGPFRASHLASGQTKEFPTISEAQSWLAERHGATGSGDAGNPSFSRQIRDDATWGHGKAITGSNPDHLVLRGRTIASIRTNSVGELEARVFANEDGKVAETNTFDSDVQARRWARAAAVDFYANRPGN